jgi:hypothetical protein
MNEYDRLKAEIARYFPAEKSGGLLSLIAGIAATGISAWLVLDESLYAGMAYPLTAVALVQIVVGFSVFRRTDRQVRHLKSRLATDPAGKTLRELERMKKVRKSFVLYRSIEAALLVIAVAGIFLFGHDPFLFSVSIGLAAQSALALLFDTLAGRRARVYTEALAVFLRAVS